MHFPLIPQAPAPPQEIDHPLKDWLYRTVNEFGSQIGYQQPLTVVVIDDSMPRANCHLEKERISFSVGMIDCLGLKELRAIAAHEVGHLQVDADYPAEWLIGSDGKVFPLLAVLTLAGIFGAAVAGLMVVAMGLILSLLPLAYLFAWRVSRRSQLREVAADQAAIALLGEGTSLADALLAIHGWWLERFSKRLRSRTRVGAFLDERRRRRFEMKLERGAGRMPGHTGTHPEMAWRIATIRSTPVAPATTLTPALPATPAAPQLQPA